jgi:hypothetical protein
MSLSPRMALGMFLLAAIPLGATISYPAPTFVNAGSQPTYIVVADFNGDCAPDFATVNIGSLDVTVRFGDGAGGFPTSSTTGGFGSPQYMALGDFNEDGSPDLVVGNRSSFSDPANSIYVLLNSGSGTFAIQSPHLALGTDTPQGLAVGDFNEDGHQDVITGSAFGTNNLSLFAGDGNGGFGAPTHPALTLSMGSGVADLTAAHLNGDSHLDLAIATFPQVVWMMGNGDGTFAAPTFFTFPSPQGEGGAVDIVAADVDHDGDNDVATAGGNVIAGASVFINNGSGSFTWHQMSMPQAPANPVSVNLADLDGDGNLDIVTANQSGCTPWGSNLAARPGNGDGTFGAPVPISIGYGPTCVNSHWQPQELGIVDLNCDGKMDIISANMATGFCSVLLSTGGTSDTTPPVVTAPPAVSVGAGAGCSAVVSNAQLGTATATDNCASCVNIVRTGVPAGNVFPVGTTIVTYTANDGHGNSAAATQNVTVTDSVAPSISAPPNATASAGPSCNATVAAGTATATDNCGGSPIVTAARSDAQPLGAPYPLGTTTITWTATDSSGNTATATQTVTVNDTTPPTLSVPPNVSALCTDSIDPGTATATDNCPGTVTVSGVRSDAQPLAAPYPVGTTTITWTALDAHGNSAGAAQTVTVASVPVVISGGTATPSSLWPPNHRMVDVAIAYSATGGCGAASCSITAIASNEPDDGLGDGDTANDKQIVDATHVKLRAERAGGGTGRVYTITITCTDGVTTTTKTVTVSVPLNQK